MADKIAVLVAAAEEADKILEAAAVAEADKIVVVSAAAVEEPDKTVGVAAAAVGEADKIVGVPAAAVEEPDKTVVPADHVAESLGTVNWLMMSQDTLLLLHSSLAPRSLSCRLHNK